tara:strand:- start:577 stop:1392 length:816 start_codon:yes stop_codon:yes gene_type:complete
MDLSNITVVITTFRSNHKIFSCIDSIPKEVKIIIVENSDDYQFKEKVENYSPNVKCFLLKLNRGYSYGNNFGLLKTKTKYALVINPDVRLKKDTLNNFLNTILKHPNFWIIGPSFNYNFQVVTEVETIKGYSIFFNLEKFKNKFFDENFFLYFEEIDLCRKIRKDGGLILVDPKILVDHDGGSSVRLNSNHELEKNRNWHWMWSTFYYHKKYNGYFIALMIIAPKLFSALIKTIFYLIIFNKVKKEISFSRLSGMFNSIMGKKSWYRPSID